tara:strand:- start:1891 stop:2889 length:999 start_codon:yes stop_codon:yes gene_type:complete
MQKKILVTGSEGFIGSHLIELLVKNNYKVIALVQYNSFGNNGWLDTLDKKIIDNLEIIYGDIRDPFGLRKNIKQCYSIINLASLIAIPFSYDAFTLYVDTNVKGTLNLLKSSIDLNIEKFIHTSTSEVYGTATTVPINEKHRLFAQSPYAASKIAADQMVNSFYSSFSLPTLTLRPFNTYGPRQSARAIIPSIITQIATNNSIKIGNIEPTRDFNFVRDIVKGFKLALENDHFDGETINLASNYEISIKSTLELISNIMNKDPKVIIEDKRIRPNKSEVERLIGDNKKAFKILKWKPEYVGLEGFKKGLKETINWMIDPNNLKKYNTEIYNK